MSKKSQSKRKRRNQNQSRPKAKVIVIPTDGAENTSAKISLKEPKIISNTTLPLDKKNNESKFGFVKENWIQRTGNLIKNNSVVAIIIFAITVFGFPMAVYQIYMYHYDKAREPSTGSISGQIIDEGKPMVIKLGGNPAILPIDILKRGFNLKQLLSIDGLSIPVKVYNENNRLLFDVDIYDNKGRNICSVVRNEWKVYPNAIYDKNSNSNAFEIVDSEQLPIFQIQFKELNQAEVGGYTISPNGNYNTYNSNEVFAGINKAEAKTKLKRIFKYPSSEYQGVLEGNSNNK